MTKPAAAAVNAMHRAYRSHMKCFIHDRLYLPGEPMDLLPHEVGPHHVPIEPVQREIASSAPEEVAPSDVDTRDVAQIASEGTTPGARLQEKPPSRKPRRRKAPGFGAEFASDIYCAEILTSKLAGRYRFYHTSEQWFRKGGRRWFMAAPTELAEICAATLEELAQYAATLPAYLRRSSAVEDVLDLTTFDSSIARAGYRP